MICAILLSAGFAAYLGANVTVNVNELVDVALKNYLERELNSSFYLLQKECSYLVSMVGSYACMQNGTTGALQWYSTNLTKVEMSANGNLTNGGVIYCKNVQWQTSITLGTNVEVIQFYNGAFSYFGSYTGAKSEATFIIDESGSTYRAWYGTNSTLAYSSTDASTVIQSATNALYGTDKEGEIYIKRDTYSITSDITIGKRTSLKAEVGTVFDVANDLTTACIIISSANNEARWSIDGLKIDLNYYNGHGIYSAHAGETGHAGHPTIQNIKIIEVNASYCGIWMQDAFFMTIRNIEIRNNRGTGMKFTVNEGWNVHFGNSVIDHVYVGCNGENAVALDIVGGSTYRAFNVASIRDFKSVAGNYAGTIGIRISKDYWIKFFDVDIEDHKIGILLDNVLDCSFIGSYVSKGALNMDYAIVLEHFCTNIVFSDMYIEAGTGVDVQDNHTSLYGSYVVFENCESGVGHPPNLVLTPKTIIKNWYQLSQTLGAVSNPFYDTTFTIEGQPRRTIRPLGGEATSPTANQNYVLANMPVMITSTGGTDVNITIKAQNGDTVVSGLTSLNGFYLPVGYRINFGGFSVAPTVTVTAIGNW